jgi:hypothetical protein
MSVAVQPSTATPICFVAAMAACVRVCPARKKRVMFFGSVGVNASSSFCCLLKICWVLMNLSLMITSGYYMTISHFIAKKTCMKCSALLAINPIIPLEVPRAKWRLQWAEDPCEKSLPSRRAQTPAPPPGDSSWRIARNTQWGSTWPVVDFALPRTTIQ